MRCRGIPACLALAVLMSPAAGAAPAPMAKAEIDYLLSTVANSDCRFYRNGNWYDAKSAAAHLSIKLQYLLAKDLVQDAEDFIQKAATQSSRSGRAYAIQCKGSAAVPAAQWLEILLARHREPVEPRPPAP